MSLPVEAIAEAIATVAWLGHLVPWGVALAVTATGPALWRAQRLAMAARAAVFLALTAIGWWATVAWAGAGRLGDDRRVVIDEVGGAALVLFVLVPKQPFLAVVLVAAFVAIDRLKPWPVDRSESIPGAAGIVLDDLAAALWLIAVVLAARLALRRLR